MSSVRDSTASVAVPQHLAGNLAAMSAGIRSVWAWIGITLSGIALVVASGMYLSDVAGAASDLDDARTEYARLSCLGDLSLSLVPEGTRVLVEPPGGSRSNYWWQRLIELTGPERVITGDRDDAELVLRLVREGGPCDGYGLETVEP